MTASPKVVHPGAGAHNAGSLAAGGVRFCVRWFGTDTSRPAGSRADGRADGRADANVEGVGATPRPAVPAVPGVRAGTAALLLHDVAGELGDWDALAGELDRAALAVSPKGLGASEDRDPYTGDALAGELAALVLHAVDGPVDVVGHGTGATLAWNLAARRPDLVRRVVLISGGRALTRWRAASIIPGAGLVRGGASAGISPAEVVRRGRICAAYARLEPIGRIAPQRAMVLWGTRDPVSPLPVAQRMVDSLTRTLQPETVRMVTLPGIGHRPLAESPARSAALVADFLRTP